MRFRFYLNKGSTVKILCFFFCILIKFLQLVNKQDKAIFKKKYITQIPFIKYLLGTAIIFK